MNQLGTKLRGRYKIIEYLSGGGFGDTYLAVDEDLPGSPKCVVKHLKPKDTRPEVLEAARRKFKREAETLYHLKHNHIPRLFAYFEENGEFYLVEDYIEGDDLSKTELCPGKQLSEAETIKLLHEILEILAFVHQQNIIHLDIKPQNMIRHGQSNELFLIDFGAVKQIQNLENIHGQVQPSMVIGTRGYMPSEQASGRPGFYSDVYAVGMIGIQALTGIIPILLQEDSNTLEVLWRNQVQVSAGLADILDQMVRYHFSQRYPTAVEALSAIASLKPHTKGEKTNKTSLPAKKSWLNYKIIALLISATVILYGVMNRILVPGTSNFTKYENSTDGITIQYPDNWNKLENSNPITNEIVEFSPQQSNSNVPEKLIITGENLSDPLSLAEYTKLSKQEIVQQNNNAKILSETDSTLAGKRAYKVVYTLIDQGNQLKRMETWTLKNFKVYSITYEAQADKYDQSLPTAEKMINTFQLEK